MLNPVNLNAAYELAKIQEEYLLSMRKTSKPLIERTNATIGTSSQGSYMVVGKVVGRNPWYLLERCHQFKWIRSEGMTYVITVMRSGAQIIIKKSLKFTYCKAVMKG